MRDLLDPARIGNPVGGVVDRRAHRAFEGGAGDLGALGEHRFGAEHTDWAEELYASSLALAGIDRDPLRAAAFAPQVSIR